MLRDCWNATRVSDAAGSTRSLMYADTQVSYAAGLARCNLVAGLCQGL